jgi:succinoglycan biosynthesis protein ExoM
MTKEVPHISVCICTFRRADLLLRLLRELSKQETCGLFTYSVVVADNDELRSAEAVVAEFTAKSGTAVEYCVEPQQNIALTRNRAVAHAAGELVAFIDDDEFPTRNWLLTLFTACNKYGADGALGPVKPHFDDEPPQWVVKGNFYNRPSYPTGTVIDGKKGRTGNALLKKKVFAAAGAQPFRPQFRTGEDQDFFTRMIDLGYKFIWCDEAMAYEVVPPIRWKRSFMLRRALLRGGTVVLRQSFGPLEIVKSLIAVAIYTLMLPFALLLGQHRFMNVLIKLFDHLGKLLALPDWNPVREPYVTD